MIDLKERAALALDKLSIACFEALGPASSWGGVALGNAEAIREFGARERDMWLYSRAKDWTAFAAETDPDLAILARIAADAIANLARSMDHCGTLFLTRPYRASYHAWPGVQ
jgi:hypothetical protein